MVKRTALMLVGLGGLLTVSFAIGFWLTTQNRYWTRFIPAQKLAPHNEAVAKMAATKDRDKAVDFYLANGDTLYGGWTFKGVLTEVTTEPTMLRLKNGEEVAKALLRLKVAYLDKDGGLHYAYLVRAIEFLDGSRLVVDITPYELTDLGALRDSYTDKIGTMVFGNVLVDTQKVIEAMKIANRQQTDIEHAEKLFEVLRRYESSWSVEFANLAEGRLRGEIEYLFPLMYWSSSFRTTLENKNE